MKQHIFVVCAYRESDYLETCIRSLLAQTIKTEIIIITSTPNDFIKKTALKYGLKLVENHGIKKGIGYDFDFALNTGKAKYVTIAHQDDTYEPDFVKKVLDDVDDSTIIAFTDYHEERKMGIIRTNTNLKIKRLLLTPLKIKLFQKSRFVRRRILGIGNAICCPSVTFRKDAIETPLFANDFKSNVDWYAWEQLSKQKGKFVYIDKDLMMHRVHEESTTTEIIKENTRTKEDYKMFCCFWPRWFAKILTKVYAKSEDSNKIT
ncbi:glycosyltransferase [Anaerosacchariphilus polymeriproducens]|uniref:Glycosyltransferase family 2 protein n=1 Tax=Anaerosacchariphilus polymeriproducens TaxID=1812858 RepID=A0A371AR81_9FIRM|nr:glycosyltransferase [Anaerosacchariphilus polymeriproducens]RDU22085.1 glycosyltransferase family 2 protein [Anaerosacchariphilus polymeriproducens]